jgi:hypothetical protein
VPRSRSSPHISFVFSNAEENLLTHVMLHELAHNFGLAHNYRGSADADSIMDSLTGEHQASALALGAQDEAALRFAYRGEAPAPRSFTWCGDQAAYVTPTTFCRAGDRGTTAREIFASYYESWAANYPFTNVVSATGEFLPERAIEPVLEAFSYASAVARELHRSGTSETGFFTTEVARDLITTSALALNFASEILALPENIEMCPWPGSTPRIYIPWYLVNECSTTMIQIPRSTGRPLIFDGIEMDGDPWREVGAYFDRQNVLWLVGIVRPAGDELTGASLYDLFVPELRPLYASMIDEDPDYITQAEAVARGSYWCAQGHVEPRRLIDPVTGAANPGASAGCEDPSFIHPQASSSTPVRMIPQAMLWAHGLLELEPELAVYRVGADDQDIMWDQLPPDSYCSVIDRSSGAEYRAMTGPDLLPCQLILGAAEAQYDFLGSGNQDRHRVIMERWFGWIELARSLRATFTP